MDILPLILIFVISIAAILLWFRGKYQKSHGVEGESSNPTAILLACWLVASAVFGPNFFILRIAGIFDITIERLLFIVILAVLGAGLFNGKVNLRSGVTIEMTMMVFVLICLISMSRTGFLRVSPYFPSPWYVFITGYLFPFIVFIYAKNYIRDENHVLLILHALFFFGIYLCLIAPFEYFNLRQFVFPRYINDPEISLLHLERARGPFLNAAFNGVGILIGFISGLHILEKKTGFTRVFYLALLLFFFPAVFFTLTRSVYLGLLITLFIFLRWYKTSFSKWKLISLPLALVLIVGIVNSPRLLSKERREGGVYQVEEVDIRLALLEKSYFLFSERPLMGIGLAQFIPASTRSYKGRTAFVAEEAGAQFQHNHLLGIATELGLEGFIAYLVLIILILRRMTQLTGKLPESGIMGRNLRVAIFAIWCVYLNNNLFVEPSNALFINAVPFLFAGLADGLYIRSLESELKAQIANKESVRTCLKTSIT
ncbi:MAG: O-antigen ligase family protein [Deltaproteobacteria bacterium]|nr:O-antigen ligase family protein [Deltaproteobacteria bacterium]